MNFQDLTKRRLLIDACVSDKEVVDPEFIGSVYKNDFQMEQLKTVKNASRSHTVTQRTHWKYYQESE